MIGPENGKISTTNTEASKVEHFRYLIIQVYILNGKTGKKANE